LAKRWWRRAYWLRRDWRRLRLLDWQTPSVYVGFGGIGDELLATCAVRALSRHYARPLTVFARYPALFTENPHVAHILPADPVLAETAATWNLDLRRPCEWQRDLDTDRQESPARHIVAEAAAAAGVNGFIEERPYLYLTPTEIERAPLPVLSRPFIAIQSSGSAARYFFRNKEWGVDRFQHVADSLRSSFDLVQLGAASDPLLAGAIDRRGLPDLRMSAAILARAALFVGQVGFLMHLARAVDCRSVIVYGGRELPRQSGYPCNENLVGLTPCSPCWQKSLCAYDRACLNSISPADVVTAVERSLNREAAPLETSSVTL
jgi:ADP-heptose:LPS heptosyltransferase